METSIILLIAAVAVVLVTSLLKLPLVSTQVKVIIATVASVVGAAVSIWLSGGLDTAELLPASLQVFGASQLIYRFIMEGGRVDKALENVGNKQTFEQDNDVS